MMKNLMIMLAVLAMATAANAGLVLYPPWLHGVTTLSIQTDPIDVADVQQAVFLAVGGGGAALDAGTMLYDGGPLSAITDLTGADPGLTAAVEAALGEPATRIDLIEIFDVDIPADPVIGVLVSYRVTAWPSGPPQIVLLNSELEVLTRIPEPSTFGLLGLGILCFRKCGRRS